MAKTFNDMFPGGEGFVAKPGRKWKSVRTGNIYSETERTHVLEGEMRGIIREPTGEKSYQPYVRDLTLLEPTGRETIHAALDAYLDAAEIVEMCSTNAEKARKNFEAEDHALYVSVQSRDERMESLKKLLNLWGHPAA